MVCCPAGYCAAVHLSTYDAAHCHVDVRHTPGPVRPAALHAHTLVSHALYSQSSSAAVTVQRICVCTSFFSLETYSLRVNVRLLSPATKCRHRAHGPTSRSARCEVGVIPNERCVLHMRVCAGLCCLSSCSTASPLRVGGVLALSTARGWHHLNWQQQCRAYSKVCPNDVIQLTVLADCSDERGQRQDSGSDGPRTSKPRQRVGEPNNPCSVVRPSTAA